MAFLPTPVAATRRISRGLSKLLNARKNRDTTNRLAAELTTAISDWHSRILSEIHSSTTDPAIILAELRGQEKVSRKNYVIGCKLFLCPHTLEPSELTRLEVFLVSARSQAELAINHSAPRNAEQLTDDLAEVLVGWHRLLLDATTAATPVSVLEELYDRGMITGQDRRLGRNFFQNPQAIGLDLVPRLKKFLKMASRQVTLSAQLAEAQARCKTAHLAIAYDELSELLASATRRWYKRFYGEPSPLLIAEPSKLLLELRRRKLITGRQYRVAHELFTNPGGVTLTQYASLQGLLVKALVQARFPVSESAAGLLVEEGGASCQS